MSNLFKKGDKVIIIKSLPHSDKYTPTIGEVCTVTDVDYRKGNLHPIHCTSDKVKSNEDWFPEKALELYYLEKEEY
jgi:hypothetical protein